VCSRFDFREKEMKNTQGTAMSTADDVNDMDAKIRALRQIAEELHDEAGEIEAVRRNTKRILASIRMLELNICDLCEGDVH
jgi:predicted transposase YbfD/YdcC